MKKNLFYTGMLLLGMTVATGCSNEETLEQVASNGKTIQAVIENVTEARTSVNDNYQVTWTEEDAFNVFDNGTKKATLTLSGGEGTTSGKFTIDNNEVSITEDMVALFPASDALGYTFATSYTSQETDAPMLGTFTNGKFTFSLLTAMVRVVVTNVPEGTATLTITAGTDIKLTGDAALTNNELGTPDGSNAVTVTIGNQTAGATLTFDVPVPAQAYTGGLNVTLTVGNDEVFNKTTNEFTAAVGKIYVFGATYVSIDEGNVQETLQEALESGEAIILTGEEVEVSVPSLELPAETTASLDLNGKKLNLGAASTALVRSASATHGIINKGTLTISGGDIVFTSGDINKSAIYNEGNITLTDVDIETNARCFANHGPWTMGQDLATHGTDPSVVATITDCEFNSKLTDHQTQGKHIYTVHGEFYSKITMKNTTIKGHGGVSVDCSYAELEKVTATHTCTTGAHDLYVACGNATVTNCNFANAAAYSDDTYGKAVVNGTTYGNGTTGITADLALKDAFENGGTFTLTDHIKLYSNRLILAAGKTLELDLNGKTITWNTSDAYGIQNEGNLTIKNGTIDFKGGNQAGAAVRNKSVITMDDVSITANAKCFFNNGEWTKGNTELEQHGDSPTIVATITDGTFESTPGHLTAGYHIYAIETEFYSKLEMKDATVKGDGGVSVDASYATLTNVKATHTCTTGAHDLYVACGNATVTDCNFANAAAYSDKDYGIAVVNKTPYDIPDGQTKVTTPINLNN